MTDVLLKPAPGRLVRDPETGEPLPEKGARRPLTTYWRRRLRDGDVVEVSAPAPTPKSAAPKAASKGE